MEQAPTQPTKDIRLLGKCTMVIDNLIENKLALMKENTRLSTDFKEVAKTNAQLRLDYSKLAAEFFEFKCGHENMKARNALLVKDHEQLSQKVRDLEKSKEELDALKSRMMTDPSPAAACNEEQDMDEKLKELTEQREFVEFIIKYATEKEDKDLLLIATKEKNRVAKDKCELWEVKSFMSLVTAGICSDNFVAVPALFEKNEPEYDFIPFLMTKTANKEQACGFANSMLQNIAMHLDPAVTEEEKRQKRQKEYEELNKRLFVAPHAGKSEMQSEPIPQMEACMAANAEIEAYEDVIKTGTRVKDEDFVKFAKVLKEKAVEKRVEMLRAMSAKKVQELKTELEASKLNSKPKYEFIHPGERHPFVIISKSSSSSSQQSETKAQSVAKEGTLIFQTADGTTFQVPTPADNPTLQGHDVEALCKEMYRIYKENDA